MPAPSTLERCQELITELAGPDATIRPDQAEAVAALVDDRRRVLVVQRTGWGKSAVYFLAARLLRMEGRGPTILVSPLLALMRDQIANAARVGLVAETMNSSNVDEWDAVVARLEADEVDLLAISPERLNNPRFVERVLPGLARRLGLVVIDEAHCISQWGHDFRPDYQRIRDALTMIDPSTPVLATTATATDWVVEDVARQLGTEPLTLRGTLDRPSLQLSVVDLGSPSERLAWLAANVPQLPGSGIVYCLTQAMAEQTARWLASRGIDAHAYTGSMETEERARLERALQADELKVLCATSALGMGFDKPNLGFAINLGAPSSITSYYQMVGRAGRALDHAVGVLLPGQEDRRIWRWFDEVSFPPRPLAEGVVEFLERAGAPQGEAAIEARVDIKRSRLQSLLKVLDIEGAVERVDGKWVRTAAPWQYDDDRYERVRAARKADEDQMLGYQAVSACRMAYLRHALDDPELEGDWSCGRCDRCAPVDFAAPAPEAIAAAFDLSKRTDVVLPARKMWPVTAGGRSSRIAPTSRPLDGRALGEAGAPGWSEVTDRLLVADDPEIAEDVLRASAAVLKRWGWPEGRPTWVTWVPSTGRPKLARRLAESIAAVGRMPVVESLVRVRPGAPQATVANSAHACANVVGAFELVTSADLPEGPVLVIDDTWRTGWTMTVVADLLRSAGSSAVYPFVLQKG